MSLKEICEFCIEREKTLWEKEKMLVTTMFSKGFLYRVVNPFPNNKF